MSSPPRPRTTWTPAIEARLRELALRDDQPSYSDIAAALNLEFNVHLTKNACIGRARRVGLPARQPLRGPLFKVNGSKVRPLPASLKRSPPPQYGRFLIYDLETDDCRWPHGDRPPFLFCGRPTIDKGCPYCPGHTKMAQPGK